MQKSPGPACCTVALALRKGAQGIARLSGAGQKASFHNQPAIDEFAVRGVDVRQQGH